MTPKTPTTPCPRRYTADTPAYVLAAGLKALVRQHGVTFWSLERDLLAAAIERMDYGKPGDPSGCYFPREWRSPGAKIGHENREAVRQFFAAHLGCSNVECARALGLSIMAVGRHIATLRKEWAE